ncbi:MAG: hypothetical protein L6R39_000306 [Caloplaca ligustica]|nr:MAG: hypothetical protein L6R39_000306 [Caloplaca ligustica]
MEHLPYPDNSPHPPIRVQLYIARTETVDCRHSIQDAGSFLARWVQYTTLPGINEQNFHENVRRIQRWLYFGLISWATDEALRVEDFIGHGSLNSSGLPGLLRENQHCIRTVEGFEDVLHFVEREVERLTTAVDGLFINDALRLESQGVALSIRVLTDSLWRARRNCPEFADPRFMRHHEQYENVYYSPGYNCDVLRQRMSVGNGWCRSMVSQILTNCTASTAYYLSSIPRATPASHSDCTDSECKLQINEDDYKPRHSITCAHAGCRMVETPLDEVLHIINEGGIPLMRLVGENLEVRKAEFNVEYTAISHVWSGGLETQRGTLCGYVSSKISQTCRD